MKKRKTTLRDLLNFGLLTETKARELAQVHRTTFDRWLAGKSEPPAATLELLRLHSTQELTQPGFTGWAIIGGRLIDPGGTEHAPDEIRRLPLYQRHSGQFLAMLERESEARKQKKAEHLPGPKLRLVK